MSQGETDVATVHGDHTAADSTNVHFLRATIRESETISRGCDGPAELLLGATLEEYAIRQHTDIQQAAGSDDTIN